MTEKQENIINAGLQLFAEEGYTATSTSKVAKLAGVSEGLIFRHFKNKEGLLKSILDEGERKVKALFQVVIDEKNSKKIILKTLQLPFEIANDDLEFWKLQFKLKWELNHKNPDKMVPLLQHLTAAFVALEYQNPALEAELVFHFLEGFITAIIRGDVHNKKEFQEFLIQKYNV